MNNREFTKFTGGVLPDATTTQKGLVKLTSDTTSTDNQTAATPGFVHSRVDELISKVRATVSVADGVLTIALVAGVNPGLIAVSGRGTGGKFFSLIFLCSYENKILADANANMYAGKTISLTDGWNPVITYKSSQIAASDEFAVAAKRL